MVEQSTHWARLVGSGPTVQLRRIHRFGCTESLLELSSQKRVVLNQTRADTYLFPGSLSLAASLKLDSLFSPDWGHTSMAEQALAEGQLFGLRNTHLGMHGSLEGF